MSLPSPSPSVCAERTRRSEQQASTGFLEKEGVKLVENNIIEIKKQADLP